MFKDCLLRFERGVLNFYYKNFVQHKIGIEAKESEANTLRKSRL